MIGLIFFLINSGSSQCTSNYSYNASDDTLIFSNQSTISNAHFYWNFGDGSGSNDISPIHVFPDDGKYLVTLYALDTLTNCVAVKENWIDVIKPDSINCNIYFTDTLIGTTPQTTNLSSNCSAYRLGCHVFANGQNTCSGFVCTCNNSLYLHGMQATSNDSIFGYRIFNAYYKTFPANYSSSTNYQNCSANFEVKIDYQANGALVTVTAMNKSGTSTFTFSGFGSPIISAGLSASYLYPYISYAKVFPWPIYHSKSDSLNGCPSVSCVQTILIQNPYYEWPPNCIIAQHPQNQFVASGTQAQFVINAPANVTKQWQQDAGLGYMNLTNSGPYSGVYTDTLSISNVQLTMNNYHYRCVLVGIGSSGSGCQNTSNAAVLQVSPTGINEIFHVEMKIYPNPASTVLNISVPIRLNRANIKVFNLLAKEVISYELENSTELNVSELNPGMYFIEFREDKYFARSTFIRN